MDFSLFFKGLEQNENIRPLFCIGTGLCVFDIKINRSPLHGQADRNIDIVTAVNNLAERINGIVVKRR